ncbi:MAG: tRNA (adenosine(37)-N6)-threonylcarbamoyltransferase complex dimerization subunit type 1 TsaB [Acidobacteria bacterium]|nr:tRNA (adenosine(37)-N6)-threonylcarbamoyltransferase complex dimerization subunit type 1 TsaB [Acidobacteriota bacterium]
MTGRSELTLAIEAAISGGSLALLDRDAVLASWTNDRPVSRAEDLLREIDSMLRGNGAKPQDLDLIAVSAGPGSFTGIRIGQATALGFKNALDISMRSISALEAIASEYSSPSSLLVALPVGRNAVAVLNGQSGVVSVTEMSLLYSAVQMDAATTYILHTDLASEIGEVSNVVDAGKNVASAVGRAARSHEVDNREPIFLNKSF